MTLVTWNRIEPINQSSSIDAGLAAPLADPLWLLGRQWQIGELTAEDAGTPIAATIETTAFPIERLRVGAHVRPFDPAMPLEAAVEPEPPAPPDLRMCLSAGRDLLAALDAGHAAAATKLVALGKPAAPADRLAAALLTAVGPRAVDAELVVAAIAARGVPAVAAQLDAGFDLGPLLTSWLAGYQAKTGRAAPSAWNVERAAYTFTLEATIGDRDIALAATDYRGGTLDWCDFTASTAARATTARPPMPPVTAVRTVLPAPLEFTGGPARRFFEIEPAGASFGLLAGAPPDVATALLVEIALVFGGDWFVAPVPLPVGTLGRVDRITVVDSFGESTVLAGRIHTSGTTPSTSWRMFELSSPPDDTAAAGLLAILPTVTGALEGPAIESVALVRDEIANLVWALEDLAPDALGLPRSISHAVPVLPGAAVHEYVPLVPPPASWFPLVRRDGKAARFVGASIHGAPSGPAPRGRLLDGWPHVGFLADDVGADGFRVERRWQLAVGRATGAGPAPRAVWISRTDRLGDGPASSGVTADQIVAPTP
jgi:hypothetical protein